MVIAKSLVSQPTLDYQQSHNSSMPSEQFSTLLTETLLDQVVRPAQYLGNEWGAKSRPWDTASIHLALAFPDIYELGMSNFGQRILYEIVNNSPNFLADRTYAPASDMESLLRQHKLPLWGWESRKPLSDFELIGFSLQYELTYTNIINMLDLAGIPPLATERVSLFPLVFAGGPASVNPEPMSSFMDFFLIGDGEETVIQVLNTILSTKNKIEIENPSAIRKRILYELAKHVPGVYVPSLYQPTSTSAVVKPIFADLPERIVRQVQPLTDSNQPTDALVPYLSLVHDRQVLEVRRGCDRGCRFCQPGYTFLPVRERAPADLLRLSQDALDKTGYQEYSMLSLCVSDYTSLHEATRALNRQHMTKRTSLSFPSQRADRMNFDLADELKAVRKSGITMAPEAGSERLRKVINKGLNHQQIISAIETAYRSGWSSVKLYFMIGLPSEVDEDLVGIIDILKEATEKCRSARRENPNQFRRNLEITCTISNFVPKPFTPFQWYGQISPSETRRRQDLLKAKLREARLRDVRLNFTDPSVSLLEAVISRGDRQIGEVIFRAWKSGSTFDAWDERLCFANWQNAAESLGLSLETLACTQKEINSKQPWDIVHVGLMDWWLANEWKKALATQETAPCSENTCHACGICTELSTTHILSNPTTDLLARNPFVKTINDSVQDDQHPSLFFPMPVDIPANKTLTKIRFEFKKIGQLRFISHLDLQSLLARAARRAGLSICYTEGFNPSPKLSLALSLPLFQEGLAEVGEIELSEIISSHDFCQRLNKQLPLEVQIVRAKDIDITNSKLAPSLANQVAKARYQARLMDAAFENNGNEFIKFVPTTMMANIADVLSKPHLVVNSVDKESHGKDKTRDIRSGIFSLQIKQESPLILEFELASGSMMHVKPSDLLRAIGPESTWRVTRYGMTTQDGISLYDLL